MQKIMPEVKKIFPNAYLGKDGKSVELLLMKMNRILDPEMLHM